MADRILVIDDDQESNWLLSEILQRFGYQCQSRTSGQEGLTAALEEPPDLILLDIMLPDQKGFEVCRELKSHPETRDVPVIFISSLQETFDKVQAFASGGVDYVPKPFEVEEALARIATHLRLRQLQRDLAAQNARLEHEVAERIRLQQQEARRVELLKALHQIGLELTSELDLGVVLSDLVRQAAHLVGSQMGGLYLLRPDQQTLEVVVSHYGKHNFLGVTLKLGEGLSGRVALTGQPLAVTNYTQSPYLARPYVGVPFRRVLGVPLHWQGRVIGVLNLADPDVQAPYSEEQIWIASLLAEQAAVAVQNARLYAQLRHKIRQLRETSAELEVLATTDKLTGAYNRRKFAEIIQSELERARRYQQPLSLIILDIDHFKRINDTCGHQVGDRVLAGVAQVVRGNIRRSDTLTRWGGEEFIVLTPGISLVQARETAERLRQMVEAHPFDLTPFGPELSDQAERTADWQTLLPVTISLGVAQAAPDETQDHLITRADNALYRAKHQGRNRVEVAAPGEAN